MRHHGSSELKRPRSDTLFQEHLISETNGPVDGNDGVKGV